MMKPMPRAKKVLIVEDENAMAHALELKLAKSGFEPTVAQNGEAALTLVESQDFDLILLDIIMPKLDGFGVLEALKGRGVKAPVVMLSNLSQPDDDKRARSLGARDFLVKSNTPIADIVARAERYVAS